LHAVSVKANAVRFLVLKAVLLKIQVLWDAMLHQWASSSCSFEQSWGIHVLLELPDLEDKGATIF
jgi:hypothetical protein